MKISYLANVRIPTEKAHGVQIMKTCEALSALGVEVELIIPDRRNIINYAPHEYYGTRNSFSIKRLPCLDMLWLGRFGFWMLTFSFSISSFIYLLISRPDAIYSRDEVVLLMAGFFHRNLFWESHMGRYNFLIKVLLKKINGLVVISGGLEKFYLSKGCSEDRILVAHDAVDLEDFNIETTQRDIRVKLGLPLDKKIVMYIGAFEKEKGLDTLLEASKELPKDIMVAIIGGRDSELDLYRNKYPEVTFLGYRSYKELPLNQQAADVLVVPNSAKYEISRSFTSPMKVFAHMASGVPIVASDLPSLREILDEESASFFTPDKPNSLVGQIVNITTDAALATRLSSAALERAFRHTWELRASEILSFVNNRRTFV